MKPLSSIRFSINGREFFWEGTDEAEGTRKLDEFMASVFAPIKNAIRGGSSWRNVLGIKKASPTLADIERRFRVLAKKHHPDKGGSAEKFQEIVAARDAARQELA